MPRRSRVRSRKRARDEADIDYPLERYRHTGLTLPQAIAANLRAHNVAATPEAVALLSRLYQPPLNP